MRNFLKKIYKKSRNNIKFSEIEKILQLDTETIVIDVRTPEEYKEGHLPNAINTPIYELEVQIDSIVKSKKDKIIVYCTKGIRSKEAVKILNNKGYINVYRIKDGIDF